VNRATIKNCYAKGGFLNTNETECDEWKPQNSKISFNDFVECDDEVQTNGIVPIRDLCGTLNETDS
jgi:hypothetical protein